MSFSEPTQPRPRALPGFQHVNRYWDKQHGIYGAKILPGEFYVSTDGEMVVTVLGSCVSACIRDRIFRIGGMNHFMLPQGESDWGGAKNASTRYGFHAMEQLINTILKNGGNRKNLEVKLFGGGRILNSMTDIGRKNIDFVRDYISREGFEVTAEDLGDIYPRKVHYFPGTGKVMVKRLRALHNNTIVERESSYMHSIEKPVEGDIELFD